MKINDPHAHGLTVEEGRRLSKVLHGTIEVTPRTIKNPSLYATNGHNQGLLDSPPVRKLYRRWAPSPPLNQNR